MRGNITHERCSKVIVLRTGWLIVNRDFPRVTIIPMYWWYSPQESSTNSVLDHCSPRHRYAYCIIHHEHPAVEYSNHKAAHHLDMPSHTRKSDFTTRDVCWSVSLTRVDVTGLWVSVNTALVEHRLRKRHSPSTVAAQPHPSQHSAVECFQ